MVASRSAAVAFCFGLCWSAALVAIAWAAARYFPFAPATTVGAGLAVGAALACNKLFMSSQYFRTPEPVASVSRQMLAEGVAAFVVVLAGGAVLFR
jgi:hypothetical protein